MECGCYLITPVNRVDLSNDMATLHVSAVLVLRYSSYMSCYLFECSLFVLDYVFVSHGGF